ncbi:DUF2971 domain-containing protein [Desulfovibrio mangrovi]|uniref:DUF2971 domain-containing protein n=1 Tax=Desulfovibrio mangrovi TaxID=2976983 RepID=UPI0022465EEF|nr:DUF2971 domain-containing protein [Desulfovibrio mangrovi]UZP68399.1 DUF2971 domain-containing protein [Desulfovibrio mangrovi]
MMNDTPSKLYKYTSPDSAEQIVANSSLQWSSPLIFNDLEELQKVPTLSPSIEESMPLFIDKVFKCAFISKKKNTAQYSKEFAEVAEATKFAIKQGIKEQHLRLSFPKLENTNRIAQNLKKLVHNAFSIPQLRILCLTEANDNETMWTQYASDSTGCCIEFTPGTSSDSYFSNAKKVDYHAAKPIVGSAYDMLVHGVPDNIAEKAIDAIYYAKPPSRSHEKEWRLITSKPDENGKLFSFHEFNTQDLTAITFGHKAEPSFIDNLSEIAVQKYEHIRIYKAEKIDSETQLVCLR